MILQNYIFHTRRVSLARCIILSLALVFTSCNKFLDGKPPMGTLLAPDVFSSEETATAAITGLYIEFRGYLNSESTYSLGLYADELENGSNDDAQRPFAESLLYEDDSRVESFWTHHYAQIFRVNACLEGLENARTLPEDFRNQLIGEALFMRAWSYFYLVNLYGDAPLVIETDYQVNAVLPRASVEAVYDLIVADLEQARDLLKPEYPTSEKIRVNRWAATAFLARVYLYQEEWGKAAAMADEVIEFGGYGNLPPLEEVYLITSSEAILHLQRGTNTSYSPDAYKFIPSQTDVIPVLPLTSDLVDAFESGDQRWVEWTGYNTVGGETYYYPTKYKDTEGNPAREYQMLFRLAEQYLIRAEANAQQGVLDAAIDDLDKVRERAGLPLIKDTQPGIGKEDLLKVIYHERRVEFFAELGHRWFDLKRTGQADAVLKALKPATWNPRGILWPIPMNQQDRNPFLEANPGYDQ